MSVCVGLCVCVCVFLCVCVCVCVRTRAYMCVGALTCPVSLNHIYLWFQENKQQGSVFIMVKAAPGVAMKQNCSTTTSRSVRSSPCTGSQCPVFSPQLLVLQCFINWDAECSFVCLFRMAWVTQWFRTLDCSIHSQGFKSSESFSDFVWNCLLGPECGIAVSIHFTFWLPWFE